jgi:uncharacterized membrane protein
VAIDDRVKQGSDAATPISRDPLAKTLGWVSLGLGIPPLTTTSTFNRMIGVRDAGLERGAAVFVGARELVAAAGLLRWTNPAWLWARVGGDAMDLAMLGRSLATSNGRDRRRTVAATAAVASIAAVDVYAAVTRTRREPAVELTASTTVSKTPDEVYPYWRDFSNLPTFMAHLDEVTVRPDGTTHWRATAPFGKDVAWDAETTQDTPGERIAWRSRPGADVDNEGSVEFASAPGGHSTEVRVRIRYRLPGGKLGEAVARYFGEDPHQQLDDDLRRFKQIVETGEVTRSDGAPYGKRARKEFPQRPAQPMPSDEIAEETSA